jgi:hypothetical protein
MGPRTVPDRRGGWQFRGSVQPVVSGWWYIFRFPRLMRGALSDEKLTDESGQTDRHCDRPKNTQCGKHIRCHPVAQRRGIRPGMNVPDGREDNQGSDGRCHDSDTYVDCALAHPLILPTKKPRRNDGAVVLWADQYDITASYRSSI